MMDVRLSKDSKGSCRVLFHRRCGITECLFLTEEELNETKRLIDLWTRNLRTS